MNKNNFRAFLVHIVIGVITFILFVGLDGLATGNKIKYAGFLYNAGAISTFLLANILYLLSGKLLVKQETKVRNILSVSGVSIIGLCLWGICFFSTGGSKIGADLEWIPFVFYTIYSFSISTTFHIDSSYVAIIFAIIPSLLMGISIQIWNRKLIR